MFKLLVTLGTFLFVALSMLALRQHRLEITSQTVKIQHEITARQQTLLDQRAEIARQTNPWALAANLKAAGMSTGDALAPREDQAAAVRRRVTMPQVETDLVAPVRGDNGAASPSNGSGHLNPNRPR